MEKPVLIFFIVITVLVIVCTVMSILTFAIIIDPMSYDIGLKEGVAQELYDSFSGKMLDDPTLNAAVKKMVAQ